jgi:hypothetical protein
MLITTQTTWTAPGWVAVVVDGSDRFVGSFGSVRRIGVSAAGGSVLEIIGRNGDIRYRLDAVLQALAEEGLGIRLNPANTILEPAPPKARDLAASRIEAAVLRP